MQLETVLGICSILNQPTTSLHMLLPSLSRSIYHHCHSLLPRTVINRTRFLYYLWALPMSSSLVSAHHPHPKLCFCFGISSTRFFLHPTPYPFHLPCHIPRRAAYG